MEWYKKMNMKCNVAWFIKISKSLNNMAFIEHSVYLPMFINTLRRYK